VKSKQAILLVGHGSRREAANALTVEIARQLQSRQPESFVAVAHLELTSPGVPEGIESCVAAGAREITLQPFLLADGRHSAEDIPRYLEGAMKRHPAVTFRLGEVLGCHELLVDLVLLRTRAAVITARSESDPGADPVD
jgi:sirohydrochlorin ferrochelatase